MLIFFEVWAAVATVLAVFFWNRTRVLGGTLGYLVRFVQDKTDYELNDVLEVIHGYTEQDKAR